MWHFLFGVWLGSLLTRSGSGEQPPENGSDGCLGCLGCFALIVFFYILLKSC